jgi:predicted  nucleic acid-binding Zn-ribbon protein
MNMNMNMDDAYMRGVAFEKANSDSVREENRKLNVEREEADRVIASQEEQIDRLKEQVAAHSKQLQKMIAADLDDSGRFGPRDPADPKCGTWSP